MNMEDEIPAPPPAAAPPAEPPAPPPPPEPPPDPDEVGAIDVQGGKHVPLEALKATRTEIKALKEQLARLPQLEQANAQLQGSLATFQQLRQDLQRPQAPPVATDADPDLIELARSLDFYKPDGAPDLDRAAKHNAIVQRQVARVAQSFVQPLQQQNARNASAANYQAALQIQSPEGVKPQKATLDWMWQNLPPEYTADPRVAQALPALALGLEALQGTKGRLPQAPAAPLGPPLHTEGMAGAPQRRTSITDAEREVLAARGMSEEKYTKYTKNYTPGRATQLEND